jgi:hypothetical protein
MAEWSKAPDSKSGLGQPNGGSNPSLSATSPRASIVVAIRRSPLKLVIGAAFIIAAIGRAPNATASPAPDLSALMRLTVDSWVASQSAGFLPYGFDFLTDKVLEPNRMSAPNLIRQAAASFALANYYEYTKDARLRDPIRRALSAFGERSLPISKGRLQRVVEGTRILSLPVARWKLQSALDRFGLLYQPSGEGKVVSPDSTYGGALSGTVALALLTELVYSRASGDESFAELRTAWLNGLLALRIPGGGFRQDTLSIDDSDYDNGEGWLALAVYCDRHRDDLRAANALSDLDDVLMRRYSETPSVKFLGWGGMAAAQRYRTTRDRKFLAYLQRQADNFAERFQDRFNADDNNCGVMEGLAATLAALKTSGENDTHRVREIRDWMSNEIAKLPRLQIQPGQQGLALGGEAYLRAPRMAEYAGGFLSGVYEPLTRVDAAGHCLSAMVMIERDQLR